MRLRVLAFLAVLHYGLAVKVEGDDLYGTTQVPDYSTFIDGQATTPAPVLVDLDPEDFSLPRDCDAGKPSDVCDGTPAMQWYDVSTPPTRSFDDAFSFWSRYWDPDWFRCLATVSSCDDPRPNLYFSVQLCNEACRPMDGPICHGPYPMAPNTATPLSAGPGCWGERGCPDGYRCTAGAFSSACCPAFSLDAVADTYSETCPSGRPAHENTDVVGQTCADLLCPAGYECTQVNPLFARCCATKDSDPVKITKPDFDFSTDGMDQDEQRCSEPTKEYYECGSSCPKACNSDDNLPCTANCVPGCFCRSGTILLDMNDANSPCVQPDYCPQPQPTILKPDALVPPPLPVPLRVDQLVCGANEFANECGSLCESTCEDPNGLTPCPAMCAPAACQCTRGFVRNDNGDCVLPRQCTPAEVVCGPNEEWRQCGNRCDPTCDNYMKLVPCPQICDPAACGCQSGFVRSREGRCVSPDQCPITILEPEPVVERQTLVLPSHDALTPPDPACLEAFAVGPCRASIPRFYYDPVLGECTGFMYGGCRGTANNFETKEVCDNTCMARGPKVATSPGRATNECEAAPETGPCRASKRRYYWDATLATCAVFIYGGCQGNGNNFETMEECMLSCYDGPTRSIVPPVLPSTDGQNPSGMVCTDGKVWESCGSACPRTCGLDDNRVDLSNCVQGCFCPEGYSLLNPNPNAPCVMACPAVQPTIPPPTDLSLSQIMCSADKEFTTCGTSCPRTCGLSDTRPCPRNCVPGCQCKDGTHSLLYDDVNAPCVDSCPAVLPQPVRPVPQPRNELLPAVGHLRFRLPAYLRPPRLPPLHLVPSPHSLPPLQRGRLSNCVPGCVCRDGLTLLSDQPGAPCVRACPVSTPFGAWRANLGRGLVSPNVDPMLPIARIPEPALPFSGACVDKHDNCKQWSEMNFCLTNAGWMLLNCQRSCDSCGVTKGDLYNDKYPDKCADRNEMCAEWAGSDQCHLNSGYMHIYCRASCRVCTDPFN